jgi:hypothetical protein
LELNRRQKILFQEAEQEHSDLLLPDGCRKCRNKPVKVDALVHDQVTGINI